MEGIVTTAAPPVLEFNSSISFSWYDYILFSVMLIFSALIGIYFGCFQSKQTADEYLMGGKRMNVIPIAMSLIASHISGVTLLAVPADVYAFGASYALLAICMVVVALVTMYVFLPVFFNLQITSTYEYLERRFDTKCRWLASFLFTLHLLFYLPTVIYIPALAFSAATGINIHLITPIVCGVCIFYTTIGGLKAVVWTDTFQFGITLLSLSTIFVLGVKSAGGFAAVWSSSLAGGRLDIFDFDPDPTKRDSFWAVIVGLTTGYTAIISVNQGCVQKFLSLPTLKKAKRSVILYAVGHSVVSLTCIFTGLIMYSKYAKCDPLKTGKINKYDQMLPFYVMDVATSVPGLPGVFIAAVFCTALSTLSANLNCVAGTLYEDFISKLMPEGTTKKTMILKMLVVIVGCFCTAMVFVVEKFDGMFALQVSLASVTAGPILSLFTLGVLAPRVNRKAAYYGAIIGLIFSMWFIFTAQYYKSQKIIHYTPKSVSTEACISDNIGNSNVTDNITWIFGDDMKDSVASHNISSYSTTNIHLPNTTPINANDGSWNLTTSSKEDIHRTPGPNQEPFKPFILFRISQYYYAIVSTIFTMIVTMLLSFFSCEYDEPVDKSLLCPLIHFLLPKEKKCQYYTIQNSIKLLTISEDEKFL